MPARPELAAVLAEVKELQAKRRLPKGFGSITVKVSKTGYVTLKPRVIVDGAEKWGVGVGVTLRPGMTPKQSALRAWREADQNRKTLLSQVERNEYLPADQRLATLSGTIERWWRVVEGSDRSTSTRQRKVELLSVLKPHVGTTIPDRLSAIRPEHVERLHQALRAPFHPILRNGKPGPARLRGTSTVLRTHDLLLQVLRWAFRQGLPVYAPLVAADGGAVERPGHDGKEKRSVSAAEALRLITVMQGERPFGPLVAVMYYQGLRDGEASALKWGDFGLEGFEVKRQREKRSLVEAAPKWGSGGWNPLLPQTLAVMREHKAWCQSNGIPTGDEDYCFVHRRGKKHPWHPPKNDTTNAHIKAALARAELAPDITAHSLRHGFADAANEAGVSVKTLADILRNDPAVALRYQHRNVGAMKDAAQKISAVMAHG